MDSTVTSANALEMNPTVEGSAVPNGTFDDYQDFFNVLDSVLKYANFCTLTVQVLFLYVIVVNWVQRFKNSSSTFFILFALRVAVDLIFRVVQLLLAYFPQSVGPDNPVIVIATLVTFLFAANFDILCHLMICVNRFTALVYPLRHSTIWSTRGNTVCIGLLFVVSVVLLYPNSLDLVFFNIARIVVSVVSLLLVAVPVIRPCSHQTAAAADNKQSQHNWPLLYEAIVSAVFKLFENSTYLMIESQPSEDYTWLHVIVYLLYNTTFSVFMSVLIVFLFAISSVARKGLISALTCCSCCKKFKNNNSHTVFTRVTTRPG